MNLEGGGRTYFLSHDTKEQKGTNYGGGGELPPEAESMGEFTAWKQEGL
jgi:hypothetical protein